jgi:hypothetical protein
MPLSGDRVDQRLVMSLEWPLCYYCDAMLHVHPSAFGLNSSKNLTSSLVNLVKVTYGNFGP